MRPVHRPRYAFHVGDDVVLTEECNAPTLAMLEGYSDAPTRWFGVGQTGTLQRYNREHHTWLVKFPGTVLLWAIPHACMEPVK